MAETLVSNPGDVVYWDGKPVGHVVSVEHYPHGVTIQVKIDLASAPDLHVLSTLSIVGG